MAKTNFTLLFVLFLFSLLGYGKELPGSQLVTPPIEHSQFLAPPLGDPPPRPTPTPFIVTAAQVFDASMIGQTWTLVNSYGDHTFISIEAAPFCVFGVCDGKTATMHFTKDNVRAYPDPGLPCELWFFIHLDSDDAWRSIGWEMIENGVSTSSSISLLSGWAGAPYTIIPASSDSPTINTAYLGTRQDGLTANPAVNVLLTWVSTWTTFASIGSVSTPLTGSVRSLVSKQCEGGTSGNCDFIVETWHWVEGVGLVAIFPAAGLNGPLDPNLAIVRVQ